MLDDLLLSACQFLIVIRIEKHCYIKRISYDNFVNIVFIINNVYNNYKKFAYIKIPICIK
jgi:hypothetical protein